MFFLIFFLIFSASYVHQSFSSLSRIHTVLHTYSKLISKVKRKRILPCNLQSTSCRSRASSDSSAIAQSRRAVRQHRPLAGVRLGLVYLSLTQLGVGVGVSNTLIDTDTDTDSTRRRTHLDFYSYVPHGARSQCLSVHKFLTSPGSSTSSLQLAQHICAQMYGTHDSDPDTALHYTTPRAERLTIRHNPERPKNSDQTRHSRHWPHTLARLASGSRRETPASACSDRRERSLHPARDS